MSDFNLRSTLATTALAGLVLAACASATTSAPPATEVVSAPVASEAVSAPVATEEEASAESGITVSAAESSLGTILVDEQGITLYLLTGDADGHSTCYDTCATAWPPLVVSGSPHAGEGVDGSLLSTDVRDDGSAQVLYNGHPLYYFVNDQAAGDVNGQGIENFGGIWYVVSPSGEPISGQGTANSSYDYDY